MPVPNNKSIFAHSKNILHPETTTLRFSKEKAIVKITKKKFKKGMQFSYSCKLVRKRLDYLLKSALYLPKTLVLFA